MTTLEELSDRIKALENNVGKKKEKVPRKPSAYNEFVKKYFVDNKDSKKPHKELFSDAAKEWSKTKK
jgi:predicted nuclease with TOPRIM domain